MKKILLSIALSISTFFTFAQTKNALLIANGNYENFGSLQTPVQEAQDLQKVLNNLGFTVTILENASREKMLDSIDDFQKTSKNCDIGFFHYGGHAVQVNGKNYLIPVDANIPDEKKVASRAVDVDDVMSSMQSESNIIILDACRNNPLPAASRSITRGLVMTEYKPKNSIIVYSAQAGKTAQDGVFTPILTKKITEDKSFTDILLEVRKEVRSVTGGEQSPGEYNELENKIYLTGLHPKIIETKKVGSTITMTPTRERSVKRTEPENKIKIKKPKNKTYNECGDDALLEEDYEKAFAYYSEGAKKGEIDCYNGLGLLFEEGLGVDQDYKKAFEYFSKVDSESEDGDSFAQCELGNMYKNGLGVKQDFKKAFDYFKKASQDDDEDALFELGQFYESGIVVEQDYKTAFDYYKKAAELENAEAMNSLGYFYKNGLGVQKNMREARKWYKLAKENGFSEDDDDTEEE